MTGTEARIWTAAFAGAYIDQFRLSERLATPIGRETTFDAAVRTTSGELPWDVADAAIKAYRQWRDDEKPGTGPEAPTDGLCHYTVHGPPHYGLCPTCGLERADDVEGEVDGNGE